VSGEAYCILKYNKGVSERDKDVSGEAYCIPKHNKHVSGQNKDVSRETYSILKRDKDVSGEAYGMKLQKLFWKTLEGGRKGEMG